MEQSNRKPNNIIEIEEFKGETKQQQSLEQSQASSHSMTSNDQASP